MSLNNRNPVSYLRISVTDLCNFRCFYCRPSTGVEKIPHSDVLRFEEIELAVRAATRLGIRSFRITGGEPLVRRGILHLVEKIASIPGVEDLAMTTNGVFLPGRADALRRAGVGRLNLSLDSLRSGRFSSITRGGILSEALAGLEEALAAGFNEIKLNTVVMKGVNEDEILSIVEFAGRRGLCSRFIETMPMGGGGLGAEWFLPLEEVRRRIELRWGLDLVKRSGGCGPAEYYRTSAGVTVGFIAPISACFCSSCNRLRMTADGMVRPCLASDRELDLKRVIRSGGGINEVVEVLKLAAATKPASHRFGEDFSPRRKMVSIGG